MRYKKCKLSKVRGNKERSEADEGGRKKKKKEGDRRERKKKVSETN